MYVCIKCYNNKICSPIIYIHANNFICPKHGEIRPYNKIIPILKIEALVNDKEVFPLSTNNDIIEFDERTGYKIIQLGENHFATERTDELTKAKIEAMKAMPNRASMDRNNQGKYRYTSFNQFIEHTRLHLLNSGVLLTPTVIKMDTTDENNGTVWLWMGWRIEHYESGQWERIVITSFANNKDKGDKHLSKAVSYNVKDMLRTVFMIPSGDEDDPDDDSTQEEWRIKYEKLVGDFSNVSKKLKSLWDYLPEETRKSFTESREKQSVEVAKQE